MLSGTTGQVQKVEGAPGWGRTPGGEQPDVAGLSETRLTLAKNDPQSPLSASRWRCTLDFLTGRPKPFRFSCGSRHSWEHLWLTRVFYFFPTPLVTFDLECRFRLLEEWLSLLPGCLGGLSSEPFVPFPGGQETSGLYVPSSHSE